MQKNTMLLTCLGLLWVGCTAGEGGPVAGPAVPECGAACNEQASELESRGPRLVQPGSEILLLAVTDDDYAVYQEGQTLYATSLRRHAERTVVGEVPGTNIAYPLQVGGVVFVWTNPQRNLPGFGVSPLILWTAAQGPRLISPLSAVGTVATAASSDDRQIVFTTNVSADGLRGDLAHAATRHALSPTILLSDIPLDFPAGKCRPLAGFGGSGASSFPIASYCAGSDTTATLSKWVHGTRTDLITNIATPQPFTLESDPQGTTFLVNLADSRVATVTDRGRVSIVDEVRGGSREFVNRQGSVVYTAAQPTGLELRVAPRGRSPRVVSPLATLFSNRYNRGGYFKSRIASPDTSLALFASHVDPATGLSDMNLLDVNSGTATVLDPEARTFPGSEIFTSDSKYAFYLVFLDVNSGLGTVFAGNRHGQHRISDGDVVYDLLRADGSDVSYVQNPVFTPARAFMLSTADLFVADASDPSPTPRLVSAQANLLYLPSGDRRRLVFASELESEGPGLYVASARP